mmetsp:Transcript_20850/g.35907  ORF Transcript_20850/g.35907 Transcript_20850/m.35907 type:complete len:82 (-) Transcript_20850:97-342(-)|eukprot:CAMPEP_0184691756 /NCGR_PEP_ID=MMETSP0313-20130426/502_1 /TAXON_ID=2792 /ORGANISM="Porphyridium aerugineum, Strain SAG 1380-2" /LENGTH=81 /DNA_ID=CAMNT_0027149517 /DNA_START=163 /DNA_END=408 /DNA_ORIENTATION=+
MGGGNGAKAATKRERNLAKAKAASGGKSQLDTNKKALNIMCNICRQSFMCTMSEVGLKQHQENKHGDKTFDDCFPNYSPAE